MQIMFASIFNTSRGTPILCCTITDLVLYCIQLQPPVQNIINTQVHQQKNLRGAGTPKNPKVILSRCP